MSTNQGLVKYIKSTYAQKYSFYVNVTAHRRTGVHVLQKVLTNPTSAFILKLPDTVLVVLQYACTRVFQCFVSCPAQEGRSPS